MGRRPTPKQWLLIAMVTALLAFVARHLWKRRSERRT